MEIPVLEQEVSHTLDLTATQAPARVRAAGASHQAVRSPSKRDQDLSCNK